MKHKIRLSECVEFLSGDNVRLREILHPAKGSFKAGYSLAWFRVLPGQKSAQHSLKGSEVYYIIAGEGRMHIGDESFEVRADDTIYIPPQAVQWIENTSKTEEIVALCIVDPAWRKDDEKVYG